MSKRRLIKKINEVSEEDLIQELDFGSGQPQTATVNSKLIAEQEQEITRLRELLEEYRMQEADFNLQKEASYRLTQQNKQLHVKIENLQEELGEFKEENNHLSAQLKQKETEVIALETTTVEIEEVERLKQEIATLKKEQSQAAEQMTHLETALIEKDQALTTKIAAKETEIHQLQEALAAQGMMTEKQEAWETVKMELSALNEELQSTDKENQELTGKLAELQEQIQQLQQENQALKEKELSLTANTNVSIDNNRVDELKQELQNVLQEKTELETTLGRIQGLNDKYSIQKDVFESELAALREIYKEKEEELASLHAELETMRDMSANGEVKGEQLAELLQAKQQINDLLLKNQSLQEEALKSQQEIGEVMVSAKKEANRIVSEAQVEAKHIINSAELEMLNIGNRAKNISNEVEESKNEVLLIYRELEERLSKLSRPDKTGK
ncbi:hypothetical protein GIX45_06990 [Erwinia sp. CPCC 100877]|nr:hypothetical protein [Erwinia sp. CPCC 100877]